MRPASRLRAILLSGVLFGARTGVGLAADGDPSTWIPVIPGGSSAPAATAAPPSATTIPAATFAPTPTSAPATPEPTAPPTTPDDAFAGCATVVEQLQTGWRGVWTRLAEGGNRYRVLYSRADNINAGELSVEFFPGQVRINRYQTASGFTGVFTAAISADGRGSGRYPDGTPFTLTCERAVVPRTSGVGEAAAAAWSGRSSPTPLPAATSSPAAATGSADVRSGSCGWQDGYDPLAPAGDFGRGVSDGSKHYDYVARGAGRDNVEALVAARLHSLKDCLTPDAFARVYAELSVLLARRGRGEP